MEILTLYTAHFGRLARSAWLCRLLLLALFCTAFGMLAAAWFGNSGAAACAFLFLWCAGAASVQRLHDSGRAGWHLFALIIPVLGPLWLLRQLLRAGDEHANAYGANPQTRRDYLQVDIAK